MPKLVAPATSQKAIILTAAPILHYQLPSGIALIVWSFIGRRTGQRAASGCQMILGTLP